MNIKVCSTLAMRQDIFLYRDVQGAPVYWPVKAYGVVIYIPLFSIQGQDWTLFTAWQHS